MIELVLGMFIALTAGGNVVADAKLFPTVAACEAANAQIVEASRRADATVVEVGCYPISVEVPDDHTL